MPPILQSIIIFSKFWIILSIYFLIPLFIQSTPCPSWVRYIDNYIPFVWWMIIPYYFYYVLLIIPPFIIKNTKSLNLLSISLIKICLIAYIFYFFWPISSSDILSKADDNSLFFLHSFITFEYLHQNAFPSLHVAVSLLIGLVIISKYRVCKFSIATIIILIFLSTFFTKQHYILDSIAGLFLGYIGYCNYNKLKQSHISNTS